MSKIDIWNKFAQKKIYINDSAQVTAGRLVYTLLVTFIEAINLLVLGLGAGIPVLLLNMMFIIGKREEKKDD